MQNEIVFRKKAGQYRCESYAKSHNIYTHTYIRKNIAHTYIFETVCGRDCICLKLTVEIVISSFTCQKIEKGRKLAQKNKNLCKLHMCMHVRIFDLYVACCSALMLEEELIFSG